LNWLRAAVLGANDGIVSVAGIVIGVAGATSARGPVFTAGLAGLVAGAVSMALGECVSVSSQRDSQRAMMAQEKRRRHLLRTPRSMAHRDLLAHIQHRTGGVCGKPPTR
jgi:VIT1/CCC1 family predicted Fe2+/Mn2+ transporter